MSPLRFEVTVTAHDSAAEDVVRIGRRYWAISGFDQDTGSIVWAEKTTKIGASSRPHVDASAGVYVEVAGVLCAECGHGPWQPTSRTALNSLFVLGKPTGRCGKCDEPLRNAAGHARGTEAAGQRAAALAAVALKAGEARVSAEWDERRRAAVTREYPVLLGEDYDMEELGYSVEAEAAALACLRFSPSVTPVGPLDDLVTPLTPDPEWTQAIAVEWWNDGGPLLIHPDSPLQTFGWKQTFAQAVHDATDRTSWDTISDTMPEPSLTGIYPMRVRWYAFCGPTLGTAAERLDAFLTARLAPQQMKPARKRSLAALVTKLIAGEGLRYLDFMFEQHHLPKVPDNHRPRLTAAANLAAAHRSLGEVYCLAWRAVRSAAAAAQATPRAPKANMTTHGVNQFERSVQRASTEPGWDIPQWREDTRLPLSALTSLVSFGLLNADPLHVLPGDAERHITDCADCEAGWLLEPDRGPGTRRLPLEPPVRCTHRRAGVS